MDRIFFFSLLATLYRHLSLFVFLCALHHHYHRVFFVLFCFHQFLSYITIFLAKKKISFKTSYIYIVKVRIFCFIVNECSVCVCVRWILITPINIFILYFLCFCHTKKFQSIHSSENKPCHLLVSQREIISLLYRPL